MADNITQPQGVWIVHSATRTWFSLHWSADWKTQRVNKIEIFKFCLFGLVPNGPWTSVDAQSRNETYRY